MTVAAVQTPAPGIQPLTKVITRYWRLTARGITADLTFSYLDPADIPGTVTEANLHFLRHETPEPADYTDQGGTINTAANTATVTGVTSFSDWTLGEAGADLAITKTDGVTTAIARRLGDLHHHRLERRHGRQPRGHRRRHLPGRAHLLDDLRRRGRRHLHRRPGAGNINDTRQPALRRLASTYTAVCAISPGATGSLTNTATVAGGAVTDSERRPTTRRPTPTRWRASADLAITKTDGVTTATPGGSVTYTITASNAGPSAATGATVADTFPASLTCTWTCVGAGGGTCTAAGSGNINDTVNLPAGGSVTYTASCTISAAATGTLIQHGDRDGARPASPIRPRATTRRPTPTRWRRARISAITKTDGVTTATAGGSVTYTITASNAGPSNATGATVADTFPASLTCTWTCAGAGGGTCTAAGSGNINDTVNLPRGGSVTYTASCTISAAATGTLEQHGDGDGPGRRHRSDPGQQLGDRHRHAGGQRRSLDHQDRRRDHGDRRAAR